VGIWVGTRFLEVAGEDFFYTFVLTRHERAKAQRVRKQAHPSGVRIFQGAAGRHVISTALDKIGVCICFDSGLTTP
jgi:hypothetical protein